MKTENWFGLDRAKDEDGEHPYAWSEKTRRMWKTQLKIQVGRGIRKFFEFAKTDLGRVDPAPAIFVFFPGDCDMSGHLVSIRHAWANLQLFNYGCCRENKSMRAPGTYFGTGAVAIWTKLVLRKLAEVSPLFGPIWEDLKELPPDERGVYLAAAPDAAWLESIRNDERRLFEAFREPRQLDRIGLDLEKPADEAVRRHMDAAVLMSEDKNPEAETLLKEILVRWPEFWRADWDLALLALKEGDPKRAYEVTRTAQRKFPDGLAFDRVGADCAIQLKDWRRAEWHLKRLWGINPWDPHLLSRYARVAFELKDYALATKLYEECRESAAPAQHVQFKYGVALGKSRRVREALALFKQMEKEEPKNALLLHHIGILLAGSGRPLEALDYCRRALALSPDRARLWDGLGFAHLKIRKYPEAAKAFLKAATLNPAFRDAWRHLLHAYHNGGERERLEGAKAYVQSAWPEQLARFEQEKGRELFD